MKWNATIIVTLFFNPHELTKIVLQKFYKDLWSQIASFGLAIWTIKVFPLFTRNIPFRERLKRSPPYSFFRHCETFFPKKISPKGPPSIFWCFATEGMLKNFKGSLLSVFFGNGRLGKKFSSNFFIVQFFDVLQRWILKMRKDLSFSAPVPSFGLFASFLKLSCPIAIFEFRYCTDLCRSRLVLRPFGISY